ncbi:cell division control protein 6 homolog [Lepeophtheirus salmonis]|uniref:Cell division control protein n=1 Tax=Lepeophtheirus salmonis TaxID=72036 RepID=A0A0K2UZR7_LEPSM|nr:cell division control protein 6 homolog [Lepeophtheirus salmonis]
MAPVTQQTEIDFPVRKLRSSTVKKNTNTFPKSPIKKTPSKRVLKVPKSAATSPTTALQNVSLNSPSARKSLESRFNVSPKTNIPVRIHRPDLKRYKDLKCALNEDSHVLLGRKTQIEALKQFFKRKGRSLYVSGAPGTGKTACIQYLLQRDFQNAFQKFVFVNCMSLRTPSAIFGHIAKELGIGESEDPQSDIEKRITSSSSNFLLVLDEIDQLESKNQEILYTLFEWPFLHETQLTLVGIANALNLTDRILPRLKLRTGICPQQLSFPAYSRQEINDIISDRLKGVGDENSAPVIHPNAIKFLAGKIAALSGDIRMALDVCRRAVEMAELKARKQTLLTNSENSTFPTVDLPLILKIVNEVYGSRVSSSLKDSDANLPLVQKLLIASLLLMTTDHESIENKRKKKVCKEVPFCKLYRTYVNVCKKRNMAPIPESECISMTSLLDSRGLIALRLTGKRKEPRLSQVSLRIDEKEVEAALKDKTLLSDILIDINCIAQ